MGRYGANLQLMAGGALLAVCAAVAALAAIRNLDAWTCIAAGVPGAVGLAILAGAVRRFRR